MHYSDLDWQERLRKIENDWRSGDSKAFQQEIDQIKISQLPRKYLVEFADLLRRANRLDKALRFLHPIFSPDSKFSEEPKAKEIATLASCQIRLGAPDLAIHYFKNFSHLAKEYPQYKLHFAFACFATWDYKRALELLYEYRELEEDSSYEAAIADINIGAALLVLGKNRQAEKFLLQKVSIFQKNAWKLLSANAMELLGQVQINLKQYSKALDYLNKSKELIGEPESLYYKFAEKWTFIAKLYICQNLNDTKGFRQLLADFKKTFGKERHPELRRDFEFYYAKFTKDSIRASQLYSTTESKHYCDRIKKYFPIKTKKPTYSFFVGEAKVFKKLNYQILLKTLAKKPLLLGLLNIFLKDAYISSRSYLYIHNVLYPGEYFNPITGPQKISRLKKRLNMELKSNAIDLCLRSKSGNYFLCSEAGIEVEISVDLRSKNTSDLIFSQCLKDLKNNYHGRSFSMMDVVSFFGESRSKSYQFIKRCLSEKKLLKLSENKLSRYAFCE
ncbi:MAG: hypothetical protein CL674_02680 [Bdellovibrionaceae bacterium]|nr:hypothetical protein [Pseudobdellovibrionaceae bacterium]|tara:strand:+ start:116786 stop:118291 length:1506 start_codon:yes stop_codon:yes gene_type:complete